jgi:hypothetical protein
MARDSDRNTPAEKGGFMTDWQLIGRITALAAVALITACAGSSSGTPDSTIMQTLTQIEADADRVADANAIKRLQRAYGYYVDQAKWDEVADLFAKNGTIEIALDGVYVGQERVRAYLYALGGGKTGLAEGRLNEHFQIQPVINVAPDGRTAKGRWRAVIASGDYGQSARWGEGTYENEYVKEDGVWKIASVHWYQTFMVPYEGGWAKNKDATGGVFVSKQLPPDRPPTAKYDVWPAVYIPPYHYGLRTAQPARARSSDPAIAALQLRAQLLQDTDQIENLVSMYGYYLDKQQWDELTELFAENATMEISQRGIYVGKKGVRRALNLFGPQNIEPNHVHNHIQMQPLITMAPDGQRAWVRSRALSELGTFGGIGVWGDSVYENEMVRENGVWKFGKDHLFTTFFAPYEPGWAMGARPTPKRSEKIPPDLPPSISYESLPEVFIPPYHYKNPVTSATPAPATDLSPLPAAARAAAERIAAKLTRLEDENAIERLQRAYGFYVDKAMWQEAADLFADDGTLEIGGRGVFVGRQRVLEYLAWLAPDGIKYGMLFNHIQLQPIVTVADDGQSAKGRWHFIAEVGEHQKSAMWGMGNYENEYVKQNGVWKIRKLYSIFRMYTPYADGWAKTAMPNTRPEKDLPPDRPPTVTYDLYPKVYFAPEHYRHPVTGK